VTVAVFGEIVCDVAGCDVSCWSHVKVVLESAVDILRIPQPTKEKTRVYECEGRCEFRRRRRQETTKTGRVTCASHHKKIPLPCFARQMFPRTSVLKHLGS
jgi:hypothetical protein